MPAIKHQSQFLKYEPTSCQLLSCNSSSDNQSIKRILQCADVPGAPKHQSLVSLHEGCTVCYIRWFANGNVGSGVKLFIFKCQLPIY